MVICERQLLHAGGVVVAASSDQQLVCLDLNGKPLASLATGGLTIHDVALSASGRFVAAGTFTSDVKVHQARKSQGQAHHSPTALRALSTMLSRLHPVHTCCNLVLLQQPQTCPMAGRVCEGQPSGSLVTQTAAVRPCSVRAAICAQTKCHQLKPLSLQVYEVTRDRAGAITQVAKSNLSLKGHSGQVTALAFSADDTRAVTASKDGTWGVWDLNVRYKLNEDAKRLLRQVQVGPWFCCC